MRRFLLLSLALLGGTAQAADYKIDPTHSFVEWRVQHLGFSWLYGRFNDISGTLKWDAAEPEAGAIRVDIDPASIDSNHAERDKHLRNEDFLDVSRFTEARFVSTGYEGDADGGTLRGELTMHGETRPIEIEVKRLGEGKDPWGGYRVGFVGTTTLDRRDFGIDYNLGPKGWTVELELGIEGKRQ